MRRLRHVDPVRWMATAASLFVAAVAVALLGVFLVESLPVWRHAGVEYLTGTEWFYRAARFGVLPMLYGTLVVSGIALALAGPLAIGAALFTAEVLPDHRRLWIKVPIELLAGVPSVVYGLLGVLLLRDWIYELLAPFEPLSGDTLLTGGVLLAVMILPTVMTLADDALRGVASTQRRAGRALGLTSAQSAWSISLPQALPGIGAALLLGLGRAMGETIAVFLVVGRQDNQWPESLLSLRPWIAAGQTLTTKLGGSETFLAWGDPLHWGAIAGLALVLTSLVTVATLLGNRISRRKRSDA